MSKILDMLAAAEKEKNNNLSVQISPPRPKATINNSGKPLNIKANILPGIAVFIVLVITVALSLKFISWIKILNSEKNVTLNQIAKLNNLLEENNRQVLALSGSIQRIETGLDNVKTNIQDTRDNLVKLQEATTAQNLTLETLTKDKNTLLTTTSQLRSQVDEVQQRIVDLQAKSEVKPETVLPQPN